MADPSQLVEVEEELASASTTHRAFFVPIVRAIAALGGRGRKREVVKKIREILQDELSLRRIRPTNRGW